MPILGLDTLAQKIVEGAKLQLRQPSIYTPGYARISYPGGDIDPSKGVCTDVVVRALRHAGIDLQRLIHEDAKKFPRAYPRIEKLDTNIDHRRVPNQASYFTQRGGKLKLTDRWEPGDFVWWKLSNGLDHIGIISDRRGPSGQCMVIHNIRRTAEEDVLGAWKIVGHYRLKK